MANDQKWMISHEQIAEILFVFLARNRFAFSEALKALRTSLFELQRK